jgi:hypothetical protein
MLIIDRCEEYLAEVRAAADKLGVEMREQLEGELTYLAEYACHGDPEATRCHLGTDFAPLSFSFAMEQRGEDGEYRHWFSGGLIWHGRHDNGGDGGAPTLSVCLTPQDGWSVHT